MASSQVGPFLCNSSSMRGLPRSAPCLRRSPNSIRRLQVAVETGLSIECSNSERPRGFCASRTAPKRHLAFSPKIKVPPHVR